MSLHEKGRGGSEVGDIGQELITGSDGGVVDVLPAGDGNDLGGLSTGLSLENLVAQVSVRGPLAVIELLAGLNHLSSLMLPPAFPIGWGKGPEQHVGAFKHTRRPWACGH